MVRNGPQRVIVGVHGSLGSLEALRVAVAQARQAGARLEAILAWTPPGGERGAWQAPPTLVQIWRDAAQARLLRAFDDGLGGVPDDLDVRLWARRGSAGPVLVSSADAPDDLLVVAVGTGGPVHRAVNGSVSRYCLAHAGCPLLVVPAPLLLRALGRHGRLAHPRGAR